MPQLPALCPPILRLSTTTPKILFTNPSSPLCTAITKPVSQLRPKPTQSTQSSTKPQAGVQSSRRERVLERVEPARLARRQPRARPRVPRGRPLRSARWGMRGLEGQNWPVSGLLVATRTLPPPSRPHPPPRATGWPPWGKDRQRLAFPSRPRVRVWVRVRERLDWTGWGVVWVDYE